jgi:hypothetical protein
MDHPCIKRYLAPSGLACCPRSPTHIRQYAPMDPGEGVTFFHVTLSLNRESIGTYGLDWKRMGAAPGIAGSYGPEQEGCFLCRDDGEPDWFARMGSHRGPVDVWAVEGIDESALVESPEHYYFVPFAIPRSQLTLLRQDLRLEWPMAPREAIQNAAFEARPRRYGRRP